MDAFGQDTIRVKTSGGRDALAGLPDIESVVDAGNYQDVRLTGDAQAFLARLTARTAVSHFEVKRPSLHDIFVRIARPNPQEIAATAGEAR